MSSNKRRRLEKAPTPTVSAFAARRNLREEAAISRMVVDETIAGSLHTAQALEVEAVTEESLDLSSSSPSRAVSPVPQELLKTPTVILSTFRPAEGNIEELQDGTIVLRLVPGERLVVLGEYEISVQKGKVALLHTTLLPSKRRYKVFAPSSHSLPVIRCLATESDVAEISLHQANGRLRSLESLSPLFGKMWNEDAGALGNETRQVLNSKRKSSFQIVLSSQYSKSYLQPIISPAAWNELMARISVPATKSPTMTLICGPKSSGKSTFAKLLTNKILSESQNSLAKTPLGVAVLDIDPGQPEYSTPGQLSLVHVQEPNLGPPFTHPTTTSRNRTLRAHTIAAITPAQDPDHYVACVLDLFQHYRRFLIKAPLCPLVVNTPGWVLGTGLEILVRLITRINPTHVIYMSTAGPAEIVNELRAATINTFHTLPSQSSEFTTRTAAHLRTMQTMSYFHSSLSSTKTLSWSSHPLTDISPWELDYSHEANGIVGIIYYGERPLPELLIDALNGSIVAIVALDDPISIGPTQSLGTPLPYFSESAPFPPEHSSFVCLALVRGVSLSQQTLQLLTPFDLNSLVEEQRRVVLVAGKFDTPGWAYLEGPSASSNRTDMEGRDERPWVERLASGRGRGEGARVWRVRRDLGKGDGGT